jgi:hypothetical protein
MNKHADKAIVERVEICNCTNTQLEQGEACGLAICPNATGSNRLVGHPRLDGDGEANAAVPSEEGRADDRALDLLDPSAVLECDCRQRAAKGESEDE